MAESEPREEARDYLEKSRAVGDTPFIVKIGHLTDRAMTARLIEALAPDVNALASTNSIAVTVRGDDGQMLFDGQRRGICGAGTLDASIKQVTLLRETAERTGAPLQLIGVGGASRLADVRRYQDAGAHAVHIATAAMLRPETALEIRREAVFVG